MADSESTEPDIEHFRALLLAQQRELTELSDERDDAASTVELDQQSVGRLSRMDALQQQAMAKELRERADLTLKQIAAALRRCDDGSYGYCKTCDEPINVKRLELNPYVTLCLACAE